MPGSPVVAGRSFVAGIRSGFLSTYRRHYEALRDRLEMVMALGLPSTRRTETYFFWGSAPHITRWAYGQSLPVKGFKGIRFDVTNVRWGHGVEWEDDDAADDQTNSLINHARDLGRSAAYLDERVFFQILQNSTDAELLSTVPNAPDGQALFSTTNDGTNDRFGASNGNLLTGTAATAGPAESDMRTDYFSARIQFRLMQDTEGQPLFDYGAVDGPAVIIMAADNEDIAAAAFQRSVIPESSAGVSSEIKAASKTPTIWVTQRVTTDDYFVGLQDVENKAVFMQEREAVSESPANETNSDLARQQDRHYIRWKLRRGYSVATPYGLVQVNNPG